MNKLIRSYYRLKILMATVLLNFYPKWTNLVFVIGESISKIKGADETLRILRSDPDCAAMLEKRHDLNPISLEKFAKYPDGTLAKVYADHMLENHLDPDFYRVPKHLTPETMAILRMRQTHDLWHTVAGFDTSVLGELGVQALIAAQIRSPISPILIGSRLIRYAFRDQEMIAQMLETVVRGWEIGSSARPLFAYDWDSAWHKQLSTVRKELNIEIRTDTAFAGSLGSLS